MVLVGQLDPAENHNHILMTFGLNYRQVTPGFGRILCSYLKMKVLFHELFLEKTFLSKPGNNIIPGLLDLLAGHLYSHHIQSWICLLSFNIML